MSACCRLADLVRPAAFPKGFPRSNRCPHAPRCLLYSFRPSKILFETTKLKPTDRALSIFEAFEAACRPLALSELAEASDMPVSTSHGVVRVMIERGYLYVTGRRKELYPTRRLVDMALKIAAHDPVLERIEHQ